MHKNRQDRQIRKHVASRNHQHLDAISSKQISSEEFDKSSSESNRQFRQTDYAWTNLTKISQNRQRHSTHDAICIKIASLTKIRQICFVTDCISGRKWDIGLSDIETNTSNFVVSLFLDFALSRMTLVVFCPSAFPFHLSSCLLNVFSFT